MTQAELLEYAATVFEDLGVACMIGGSQASVYYGEPRFTQDIDIVADLDLQPLSPFVAQSSSRTEDGTSAKANPRCTSVTSWAS